MTNSGHIHLPRIVKLVIFLLFISTAVSVSMRIVGEWSGIAILRDTLPTKVVNTLVAISLLGLGFLYGFKRGAFAVIYLVGTFSITGLLTVHLLFSPPAQTGSWNTIPFELVRFFSISFYLYAIFYIPKVLENQHGKIIRAFLYLMGGLVIVALLQSKGLLPNFYFQWYGSEHLPRPTGGLEHPHFFALLLIVALAVVNIIREKELISPLEHVIWNAIFLLGIVVSTSRVGFVAALVFLAVLYLSKAKPGKLLLWGAIGAYVFIGIGIGVAVYSEIVGQSALAAEVEVFLSAFIESFASGNDEGDFLRGRGERWQIELSYITANDSSFLFGYGHQPFVSHNLILRQMQVSGLIGTLFYIGSLLSLCIYWISATQPKHRSTVVALLAALLVASITFPVLVSVPIACALTMAAFVSIPQTNDAALRAEPA